MQSNLRKDHLSAGDDLMAISRELNGKEVQLKEHARLIFANVQFSAGLVCGNPDEEIYLRVEPEGRNEYISYMQEHEALAIISVLGPALVALDVKGHEIEPGRGAD